MPYILLVIGLLLSLLGLYKFFSAAGKRQIVLFLLGTLTLVIVVALFTMAVTGRLPAALGLLAALLPLASGLIKVAKAANAGSFRDHDAMHEAFRKKTSGNAPMTRAEALDVLGLSENAGQDEVLAAHRRLIGKVHPDREGSKWLAAKINEARDTLISRTGTR